MCLTHLFGLAASNVSLDEFQANTEILLTDPPEDDGGFRPYFLLSAEIHHQKGSPTIC